MVAMVVNALITYGQMEVQREYLKHMIESTSYLASSAVQMATLI